MADARIGSRRSLWIACFLLFLYALRLFLISRLQLAPDEACYWYWSKHLDLSYVDHPPMVAYIMALFTWIGGDNEFAVRLGGLLCTALSQVFLYLAVKRLSGSEPTEVPWEVLFVLNLTLLFSAGCIIQTPDTPLVLFWTVALYGLARVVTAGESGGWVLAGVALGLGLLSKFTMALLVPCVFAFLVFSTPHRYWLRRKEPYLATLLGMLIFSPVVVWNIQHRWVSFSFLRGQAFSPAQEPAVRKLLEYVGGQIGVITPLLFFALVFYSLWSWFFARQGRASEYLFLSILSWPLLIFFGASSASGQVAEPNWPAPAYLAGLPLMWLVYRRHFQGRIRHRRFVQIALGLALIVNGLIYVHLIRPVIPLPRGMDTTWQLHGWRELGEKIEAQIEAHPWKAGYFLAGIGPPTVAEAVFYTHNRHVGLDFTRPDHYTFLRGIDRLQGKNAIIILLDLNRSTLEGVEPYFDELVVLGQNRYFYRGKLQNRLGFHILLGRNFRGNWPPAS